MRKKCGLAQDNAIEPAKSPFFFVDVAPFSYYNKVSLYNFSGFEWDTDKQVKVLVKHGLDLAVDAQELFNDPAKITLSSPQNGEERYKTVGLRYGKLHTVIHTPRNGTCRIITMRRAHKDEEEAYNESCKI